MTTINAKDQNGNAVQVEFKSGLKFAAAEGYDPNHEAYEILAIGGTSHKWSPGAKRRPGTARNATFIRRMEEGYWIAIV